MLSKTINDCKKTLYKEIVNNNDKTITKLINEIRSMGYNEEELNKMIKHSLIPCMISEFSDIDENELSEQMCLNYITAELKGIKETIPYLMQKVRIEVKLKRLEKYFSRTLEIPYSLPISYFCYAILYSFGAGACYQFKLIDKNDEYCPAEIGTEAMNNIPLFTLGIKKNSKLTLLYDFGDSFEFIVTVKDVIPNKKLLTAEDIKVVQGKGNCIWEDNHEYMELYYLNRDEFNERKKKERLDDFFDDFINEELDVGMLNDLLLSGIKMMTQHYEEYSDDYFENMNYLHKLIGE